MSLFEEASIQFLDDQQKYLSITKELFKKAGKDIVPTNNVETAQYEAISDNYDIFLSDFDLKYIPLNDFTGFDILGEVRRKNDHIFLALYTAFENTLSKEQIKFMKDNRINIYTKDNQYGFIEDLKSDYNDFRLNQEADKRRVIDMQNQLVFTIYSDVLHHLKNISNQEMIVPIEYELGNEIEITVSNLYDEVYKKSKIGMAFIYLWYDNMKFIKSIEKNK